MASPPQADEAISISVEGAILSLVAFLFSCYTYGITAFVR